MKISKRLAIVLAIAGTMAAVAGSVIAYLTLIEGKAERIKKEYKTHLDELGRFHKDEKLSGLTLLKNLKEVINERANPDTDENRRLRNEVATELIHEFEAGDYDFKQPRLLELDFVALHNWQEYKELLVKNPYSNINVVLQYNQAIGNLRKEERQFVEAAIPLDGGGMDFKVQSKDSRNEALLRDLHNGYREHVALLKDALGVNNDQVKRDNLRHAFCWYSVATNNPNLTKDAFGYNSTEFEAENRRCSQ